MKEFIVASLLGAWILLIGIYFFDATPAQGYILYMLGYLHFNLYSELKTR